MADEQGTVETPAETTVVNDGIIDLDAPATAEAPKDDDGEKPEGEVEEAKPEGEEGDEEKPRKHINGSQKAKIRQQRLLDEISAKDRRIEELERSQSAPKVGDSDDKPPREEDFNGDFFAFQTAKTAYEAGKAADERAIKRERAREESERNKQQAEIARERATAHAERVEDAREVIADFDKVMEGMKGVNVRDELIHEIMSSDNSAVIAYHLAKNPEKLNALNSMSGRELAREMGRLEATVRLPEAKKATTAPAPLAPVKGGASPSSQEGQLEAYLKKTYGDRRK